MTHHSPDTAHALISLLVDAHERGDAELYDALAELAADPDALAAEPTEPTEEGGK